MARWGNCDVRQLKQLQKTVNRMQVSDMEQFCEDCAKELASRLLDKVIKRTPVGEYPSEMGKNKSTVRRGWTAGTEAEAESGGGSNVKTYADSLPVTKSGNVYQIEIINPVNYASDIEFGYRTSNNNGWVNGHFMLTISEQELEGESSQILENKLKKYLGDAFNAE